MPRTANRQGRKKAPEKEPLEEYNSLEPHKQLICWNYFQYIQTGGKEGWDPKEVGSVFHQRSSLFLQNLGSTSWFRHFAKQMVTLAQKFAQRQQVPPKPKIPGAEEAKAAVAAATTPGMSTPYRAHSPVPPTATAVAADTSFAADEFDQYDLAVPYPVCFGQHSVFNYDTRKKAEQIMVRIIVHNGLELTDIEYEWITPRILRLWFAWPEWFQKAEEMANFCVNDSGLPMYPPEHPLMQDTAERNQGLVGDDERVWDYGYVKFDQDMKNDDDGGFDIRRKLSKQD